MTNVDRMDARIESPITSVEFYGVLPPAIPEAQAVAQNCPKPEPTPASAPTPSPTPFPLRDSYRTVAKLVRAADDECRALETGHNAVVNEAVCKLILFAREVVANPSLHGQLRGFSEVKVCRPADDFNRSMKYALASAKSEFMSSAKRISDWATIARWTVGAGWSDERVISECMSRGYSQLYKRARVTARTAGNTRALAVPNSTIGSGRGMVKGAPGSHPTHDPKPKNGTESVELPTTEELPEAPAQPNLDTAMADQIEVTPSRRMALADVPAFVTEALGGGSRVMCLMFDPERIPEYLRTGIIRHGEADGIFGLYEISR